MGKHKACLIINPRDGQNIVKLADILAVLHAAGYETSVALKEYGGHTQELARYAAEEGYDLVIGYGGDGTLNQVVNGVLDADGKKSTVGVIPGGTANLWANEIGVPTANPVLAALSLLNSEARRVDVGHVGIEQVFFPPDQPALHKEQAVGGEQTRAHFLLMAGLGLDAVVMQGVSKPLKHKIRQLAVGLAAARELPTYRPFSMEIRDEAHDVLWQGQALQVVIGNTRLYADILHITPDAYINDGQLDVCVITAGNPLGTAQQIFSLLLRRRPDDLTTEYFRGQRLFLRLPAGIGLQLDGSAVKLKEYLSKEQKRALKNIEHREEVLVEYRFEALSQPLRIAVPRTYDNVLFTTDKTAGEGQAVPKSEPESPGSEPAPLPETETNQSVTRLRQEGRRIRVVGVGPDVRNGTYIVAGTFLQSGTGTIKPVAVRIDTSTTLLQHAGLQQPFASAQHIAAGSEIFVTGKKDQRGVIKAKSILLY